MRVFKSLIIFIGILLLFYSCSVFHYNKDTCRGTEYQDKTFALNQTIGRFNICGNTHYDGGVLNVPLPKNQTIHSWFAKPPPPRPGTRIERYHLRSMFYVSFLLNDQPRKIKFTGISWGTRFPPYRDPIGLRDSNRELRESYSSNRLNTAKSISMDRFADSKFNKYYDIYLSKDSTQVTKIFHWYNEKGFHLSTLEISLLSSEDVPIKYGTPEYSTFKSCMLDDIVFHFSQARMDSIALYGK